jgi:hypothetical protein
MGKIKLKSNNISTNKNPHNNDDDIYCYPVLKSRKQELEDRLRKREFPGLDDDLHKLLVKSNATLIKSEEHLPTTTTSSVNNKQTLSRQDLDQQQRESWNRVQNRYWTWK